MEHHVQITTPITLALPQSVNHGHDMAKALGQSVQDDAAFNFEGASASTTGGQ